MLVSLDKVGSSNPNLTAAHAGASTGKTGHLQPNAANAPDVEGGLFCVFQTRFPHSSTLQVREKPALLRKTTIFCSVDYFAVLLGPPASLHPSRYTSSTHEALTAASRWHDDRRAAAGGLILRGEGKTPRRRQLLARHALRRRGVACQVARARHVRRLRARREAGLRTACTAAPTRKGRCMGGTHEQGYLLKSATKRLGTRDANGGSASLPDPLPPRLCPDAHTCTTH